MFNNKYNNFFLIIFLLLSLVGCKEQLDEHRHPLFLRATKYKEDTNYSMARDTFEKYLLLNPKSYLAHNELAILCEEDYLNDKVFAIYHYRQYIELAPSNQDKENAKIWLESAEEQYLEDLKVKYKDVEFEQYINDLKENHKKQIKINKKLSSNHKKILAKATEIQEINWKLRQEVAKYRTKKLKDLKKEPVMNIDIPDGTTIEKEPEKEEFTIYKVVEGDTLSKISQKVYGTSQHYKKIYDFNKDIMKNISTVKVGQKLKIPKK